MADLQPLSFVYVGLTVLVMDQLSVLDGMEVWREGGREKERERGREGVRE